MPTRHRIALATDPVLGVLSPGDLSVANKKKAGPNTVRTGPKQCSSTGCPALICKSEEMCGHALAPDRAGEL